MSDPKQLVDGIINTKKVAVFSKKGCPYCDKAKTTFSKYIIENLLSRDEYEVLEIDELPNCSEIQDHFQKLTGARSVPRVFINQECIGGGDNVVAMDKSGELKALLAKPHSK